MSSLLNLKHNKVLFLKSSKKSMRFGVSGLYGNKEMFLCSLSRLRRPSPPGHFKSNLKINSRGINKAYVNMYTFFPSCTSVSFSRRRALRVRKKMSGDRMPVKMIGDILTNQLPHMQPYIRFCLSSPDHIFWKNKPGIH